MKPLTPLNSVLTRGSQTLSIVQNMISIGQGVSANCMVSEKRLLPLEASIAIQYYLVLPRWYVKTSKWEFPGFTMHSVDDITRAHHWLKMIICFNIKFSVKFVTIDALISDRMRLYLRQFGSFTRYGEYLNPRMSN